MEANRETRKKQEAEKEIMQIPFIGGAYKGYSSDYNAQECINLYPQLDKFEAKNVRALIGTPGMTLFCDPSNANMVRGLHVMGTTLYAVVGNTVYSIDSDGNETALTGTLTNYVGYVWMANNGKELFIVDSGLEGYLYDTEDASPAVTAIADADFPTPTSVTFQDGYFIITKDATGRFHISSSYDGTAWDATEFATAESNPDNVLCCLSDHGVLWLFGADSVEIWANTGAADFPFERIPGVTIQEGLGARNSVAQLDNRLFFFTNKRRVFRTLGYSPQIISTPHLEYILASYRTVSDAIGFGYSQEGHAFYFLTFPTEGKTWCYDASTGYWHQRQSYIADTAGYYSKHRANCYAFCYGKHLIGDFENGKIYSWDTDVYTDAGETIRRLRRAQVIHSDRKQIFFNKFEVDFESGVGLTTGQGDDPQAMLRWSDDGGHVWSHEHWTDIGPLGEYTKRAAWRRLGRSRNRIMEMSISDPVKVVMVAAHLDAEIGAS